MKPTTVALVAACLALATASMEVYVSSINSDGATTSKHYHFGGPRPDAKGAMEDATVAAAADASSGLASSGLGLGELPRISMPLFPAPLSGIFGRIMGSDIGGPEQEAPVAVRPAADEPAAAAAAAEGEVLALPISFAPLHSILTGCRKMMLKRFVNFAPSSIFLLRPATGAGSSRESEMQQRREAEKAEDNERRQHFYASDNKRELKLMSEQAGANKQVKAAAPAPKSSFLRSAHVHALVGVATLVALVVFFAILLRVGKRSKTTIVLGEPQMVMVTEAEQRTNKVILVDE